MPDFRDVPYVPTPPAVVTAMLRFARVRADDVVYDLGCGDGRICPAAARQTGCRAVGAGVGVGVARIVESTERLARSGLADRVRFECRGFFGADLRGATVLLLHLLSAVAERLIPKFLAELRPGARIVLNTYDMNVWPPDETLAAHGAVLRKCVVPAAIGGAWCGTIDGDGGGREVRLDLAQRFQRVTGRAALTGGAAGAGVAIAHGRLAGPELAVTVPGIGPAAGRYRLRAAGNRLTGDQEPLRPDRPTTSCAFDRAPGS